MWFFAVGLAIVAIIGVIAVVVSRDSGDGDGDSDGDVATEVAASVQIEGTSLARFTPGGDDPAVGERAPVATGEDFDGNSVAIGTGGHAQLVVFLAHWCPHCQAEVPRIVDLAQSGGIPSDVELVGVATSTTSDRDNYPPSEWLEREGWPGSVLVDTGNDEVAGAYGLTVFPFFVVLDDQGRVVERRSGELSEDQLRDLVDQAVDSTSSSSSSAP